VLLRLWTNRPAVAPSDVELRGAGDEAIPDAGAAVVCERYMHQPDYWARLDVQYRQRYGFDLDGRVEVTRSKGTP